MTTVTLPPVFERLLVALFVVAVSVPLAGTIAGVDEKATMEENREAAEWPGWPGDRASLASWPDRFTKAFADRFAYRSALVRLQARARVDALGTSPTPDVLIGREPWLFYGTDGAIEDITGVRPFSAAELDAWRDTLQHTQDWLADRGIPYLFVIAPDKPWIYPEALPDGLNRHAERARVNQLVAHLAAHSTVRVLDLRPSLEAARESERLYYHTDTHWNELGAYVAYREIMSRVGPQIGESPRPRTDFAARPVSKTGYDLARMLGLGRVLVEDEVQLDPANGRVARVVEPVDAVRALMNPRVVTEGPPHGPSALVFRDSFGSAVIPFLAEHFSRAVFVWQNNFEPALVDSERPTVVIQEWVSRHLYTATPYDAVALLANGQ